MTTSIVAVGPEHLESLRAFFARLPDHDVTFIKENVRDPAVAREWVRGAGTARQWIAIDESGRTFGVVRLVPMAGWSSHVGSLRVVIDPDARGDGLGGELTRHALREAIDMKLLKIVVEVVAKHDSAVRLFDRLGFRGEALLTSYIRDHTGDLQDVLLLAHDVLQEWSVLATLGVQEDLSE